MKEKYLEGIVMKVTEEHIVLLTESGSFRNIPRGTNEIPLLGQHFRYNQKSNKLANWKKYTLIAAVFLIVIMGLSMIQIENSPAYIIVVDINPSIEIFVSRDLKVIKSRGINSDGKEIIDSLVLGDVNIYIENIIDKSIEKGYFDKDEIPYITTSVIILGDHRKEILEDIKGNVEEFLREKEKNIEKNIEIEIDFDSKEHYEEAKNLGISVNYYKMYNDFIEKGIVENIEETRGKSISQLKKIEKEYNLKMKGESSPGFTPNAENNKNKKEVSSIKNREENNPVFNGTKSNDTNENSIVPGVGRVFNIKKRQGRNGLNIRNKK